MTVPAPTGPRGRRRTGQLRAVPRADRATATTVRRGQQVQRGTELAVLRDAAGRDDHLAAAQLMAPHAAQQQRRVVARLGALAIVLPKVSTLVTTDVERRAPSPTTSTGVPDPGLAALDRPGGDGTPAGDRQNAFSTGIRNGASTNRSGTGTYPSTASRRSDHRTHPALLPGQCRQPGDPHDRHLVAGVPVRGQQLAHLQFDQLGDLLVGRVGLVERDDDVRHAYLPGEHDMLPRLRHHAVKRGDHEDRAVHLRRPGDHVLDVVGVARHVDMRVVPGRRLVLDMGDVDRDAPVGLLRCPVDHRERNVLAGSPIREYLRDGRGERRLPVIDVPHRADVEVRLVPDVNLLGHDSCVPSFLHGCIADPRALLP